MSSIFSCVFAHLYVFLEKCLFKSSATFWLGCFVLFLVLSYMSGLYILEINTLSVTSFANTISHSVDCLFVLFMVSFAVQKLFNLIRSHLFIFVFIFITLGGGSKKDLAVVYVKECSAHVSSKSFIVSSFIFGSLIHFEFIFVYGVKGRSNFILLHLVVHFSQQHLLKRVSFLCCIFLLPLS